MFRAAILAAVIVCITHAMMSIPGSDYAPVSATSAYDTLPIPGACPNGQCPMVAPGLRESVRAVAAPVVSAVRAVGHPHTRGQWSYPGDVYSHLAAEHGVSGAGLTLAQAETLHSNLHEGRTSRVSYAPAVTYGTVTRSYIARTPVRSFVRSQPLRTLVRSQPVRTALRRVFCR